MAYPAVAGSAALGEARNQVFPNTPFEGKPAVAPWLIGKFSRRPENTMDWLVINRQNTAVCHGKTLNSK